MDCAQESEHDLLFPQVRERTDFLLYSMAASIDVDEISVVTLISRDLTSWADLGGVVGAAPSDILSSKLPPGCDSSSASDVVTSHIYDLPCPKAIWLSSDIFRGRGGWSRERVFESGLERREISKPPPLLLLLLLPVTLVVRMPNILRYSSQTNGRLATMMAVALSRTYQNTQSSSKGAVNE